MSRVKRWFSTAAAALCSYAGQDEPASAIRRCADTLLAHAGATEPPVDLNLLASCQRVRKIEHVEMVEAGRLIPDGDGYVIQVNARHPDGKRRFTVGHEICHTFFNEAHQSSRGSIDMTTGLFDIREEEEYLCDVGAAHLLLNPRWLLPMAESRNPSLEALLEIARACAASIEATAFEVAQAGCWPCTFVFWEPGFRKSERVASEQVAFEGWEDVAQPRPKLRASRVYGADGTPFIPKNKSVSFESGIYRSLVEETHTEGEESFEVGRRTVQAWCHSDYMPYYDDTGALRPRVVSCIVWERAPRTLAGTTRTLGEIHALAS